MRISPGWPDYAYGAKLVAVQENCLIDVDIRLRHIGVNALGDQDYGLGIRRIDGWLVARARIYLAGVYTALTPDTIRRHLPTDQLIVRTHRPGPDLRGAIPAHLWAYGEEKSVNYQLGGVKSSAAAGHILR